MTRSPAPDADLIERSVSLDSPGGDLAEGIEFGLFMHQAGLSSIVKASNECHFACAIVFFGGIARGAAASGFGRRLQVGAKLGFHGFSTPEPSKVALLKHAFDAARVINAVIVQYANEMGGVDLALLSELISVDPTDIRTVATPRELRGLSIEVVGSLPPRPADWALNACTRAVNAHRPIRDCPWLSASRQAACGCGSER